MKREAVLLTPAEVQTSLEPLREAATALRVGVATELQWATIGGAIEAAVLLEQRLLPRGLAEHLQSALIALQEIRRRALAGATWLPVEIYLQEMEHVDTAVDLHEWQLLQLSAAEANSYLGRVWTAPPPSGAVDQVQGVLA
jgi:hypothetical protein